jgi:GNAT superfamily N-acetyltransferase
VTPDLAVDLALALAADRAIRRRAAREARPLAEGLMVRHPELYDVHYLNAVLLDPVLRDSAPPAPVDLDGAHVAAVAERWLGDLGHRHLVFDDAGAGEHAAAQLAPAGWERSRTVYMAFADDPSGIAGDPRARVISESELQAFQLTSLREEAPAVDARTGLVARLVATQSRLRTTTPCRCFGAGESGAGPASACTLFCDDDVSGRRVATVEEVGTLAAHRGRGLARAVVVAAVAYAARWGADLIVVPADADDWPQLMYARLGFAAVGRQVTLTRRTGQGGAGSGSVSGGV